MDCVGFGFQVVVVERLGLTFTKEGLAWTRWCLGFWGRQRRRKKRGKKRRGEEGRKKKKKVWTIFFYKTERRE